MGRVAAQPVGQTVNTVNGLPAGRAKRVNPRLTAIFKEELVRKYGLFFSPVAQPGGVRTPDPAQSRSPAKRSAAGGRSVYLTATLSAT